MEVEFKIDGLDQIEKALKKLGAEVGAKELRGALRDAALPALEEMQLKAPVFDEPTRDVYLKKVSSRFKGEIGQSKNGSNKITVASGGLKDSIKRRGSINKKGIKTRKFDKDTTALVSVGTKGIFYAHLIEFGTQHIKAQPFIRPAAEKTTPEAIKIFNARIQKRIQNATKRLAKKNKSS